MKMRADKKNNGTIQWGRTMERKIKGIFNGREQGLGILGYLVAVAVVTVVVVSALAGPALVRVVTKSPDQYSAPNKVTMDESVDMAPVQHAARDGKTQPIKDGADVVKGATTPTSAQDWAISHIVDTAVVASTADTRTTTTPEPTVTGEDLDEDTETSPVDDGAADGTGGYSGGTSGGGCNDGCIW